MYVLISHTRLFCSIFITSFWELVVPKTWICVVIVLKLLSMSIGTEVGYCKMRVTVLNTDFLCWWDSVGE